MEFLNQWGIAFILWVQSINPGLDPIFSAINFLQTEDFFLIALPIVFWCINKRVGATLAVLFLTSDFVVRLLKGITGVARPYDVNSHIRNLDPQTDLSFPSAGAMDTMIFWGFLATEFEHRVLWVWSVLVICLMAFTRVYLGVHYPADVLASVLIGTIIIVLVRWLRLPERVAAQSRTSQWFLAIAFPIVLALIRLNPETAVTLGAMLGFGIGLLLESHYIRFEPRSEWWKQVIKVLIGLAVGLAVRMALKPLFPAGDVFTLVRYGVIGLWMGAGAPWIFVITRLAKSSREPTRQPEAALS